MFELTPFNFIIIAGFGFCIGIMGSVLGIGGGAFMVPFFVLCFKIPIHNAIAISLVAIVALSSSVASINVEKGIANMRLGIILEMLMVAGSITGALILFELRVLSWQIPRIRTVRQELIERVIDFVHRLSQT